MHDGCGLILGGTFDPDSPRPPRRRRRRAAQRWRSTRVWLVPARVPPHRRAAARVGGAPIRDGRAGRAGSSRPARVGPGDGRRRAVLYRRARSTGWRRRASTCRTLFFVTGADAFRDIATWKDYPAHSRPMPLRRRLAARAARRRPAANRCPQLAPRMIDAPRRARRARPGDHSGRRADGAGLVDRRPAPASGRAPRSTDLVPPAVAAYIAQHGLYRTTLRQDDGMKTPHASARESVQRRRPTPLHRTHAGHRRRSRQEGRSTSSCSTCAKASAFTDFFVICTGTNVRQVQAIADARQGGARQDRAPSRRSSKATTAASGSCIDYFDFIVHVFTPATREFYGLERLWGDAERIEVSA